MPREFGAAGAPLITGPIITFPLVWHQASRFETALNSHCAVAGEPSSRCSPIQVVPFALEDTHERGVWLSPRKSASVLETRHERDIVNVLGQFATGLGLPAAGFDVTRSQRTVRVVLEDGCDVMLFDPALGASRRARPPDQRLVLSSDSPGWERDHLG